MWALEYITESHTVTTCNIMIQDRLIIHISPYCHTPSPHRPVLNSETCFWFPACEAPLSVLLPWLEVKAARCPWSCWFAKIHRDSFGFCKNVPKFAKTAGAETTALGAFTASTADFNAARWSLGARRSSLRIIPWQRCRTTTVHACCRSVQRTGLLQRDWKMVTWPKWGRLYWAWELLVESRRSEAFVHVVRDCQLERQ